MWTRNIKHTKTDTSVSRNHSHFRSQSRVSSVIVLVKSNLVSSSETNVCYTVDNSPRSHNETVAKWKGHVQWHGLLRRYDPTQQTTTIRRDTKLECDRNTRKERHSDLSHVRKLVMEIPPVSLDPPGNKFKLNLKLYSYRSYSQWTRVLCLWSCWRVQDWPNAQNPSNIIINVVDLPLFEIPQGYDTGLEQSVVLGHGILPRITWP